MVLNFGLLGEPDKVQSSDYKSADSHQLENAVYELVTDANQWEEVLVVSPGKTFYLSTIVISNSGVANVIAKLGTGAPASEVEFLIVGTGISVQPNVIINLDKPIKFVGGTRISARTDTDNDTHFTLVGWEE